MDDKDLDHLLRVASDLPGDETRLAQEVLRQIRRGAPAPRPGLFGARAPGLAMAGFAALLVATPFVVAGLPGGPSADGLDRLVIALAVGDPGFFSIGGGL